MRGSLFATLLLAALVVVVFLCLLVAASEAGASTSDRARARAAVCSVFVGWRCAPAMRVVACETGGTFDRFALGSAGERGLFQIHPVHFRTFDRRRLFERVYNARAAYRLSRGGTYWRPWTCRP